MSDCINCQCEEIVPGSTACASLYKQNDDRIKLHSLVLRDTTLCDLPEQTSKAFYSQWCFNKNLTSQVCWLMNNSSGGKTYKAGKDISISNDGVISFTGTIPTSSPAYDDADLRAENARLKGALMKIINNLTASGAWQGGLEGDFVPRRNIATGNINLFSNTVDSDFFIRTNNGKTENDLAGGIN